MRIIKDKPCNTIVTTIFGAVVLLLMIPGIASFVPATWTPDRIDRRNTHATRLQGTPTLDSITRSEALRNLAIPLAGFAAFRTGAALSVIGQPRLPKLTGPYDTVGVRIVRIETDSGGCRAKVFYPARSSTNADTADGDGPYCTNGRETSDGMAGLVGFRQLGLSFLLSHLASATSGTTLDADPENVPAKLPLLVYSHGYGGNMDMATYLMRQIASHGAIVVALEHTDGTASSTRLADDTVLPFSPGLLRGSAQLERRAEELLAATKPTNLPSDLPIDETRVFLGGHSYGGPSCLVAASKDILSKKSSIRGLVLHDPALGMGDRGLDRVTQLVPTVSITSDEYDRGGVRCGQTLHARGCYHGNFVDAPLWAPLWVMRPLSTVIPAAGPCDPNELHSLLAASAVSFMTDPSARSFDIDDPLLEPR